MSEEISTLAKSAKALYPAQLSRLTTKANEETALLDHLREFTRKRLEIERDCCERLEKLAKSYGKIVQKGTLFTKYFSCLFHTSS
jgi:hypothetical protein